jgi:hypothetical protein
MFDKNASPPVLLSAGGGCISLGGSTGSSGSTSFNIFVLTGSMVLRFVIEEGLLPDTLHSRLHWSTLRRSSMEQLH